ncbi:hypothetical protein ACFL4T_03475 [candidate division KSB1 bacterium]
MNDYKNNLIQPLWYGTRSLKETDNIQSLLVRNTQDGGAGNYLLFLNHPPTFAIGARKKWDNLLSDKSMLGKQVVSQAEEGFVKLIFEEGSGILAGGFVIGENASQFIAQVTMGIEMAAHVDDFALTVPVHPSTPEAFGESADDVLNLAVHLAKKK